MDRTSTVSKRQHPRSKHPLSSSVKECILSRDDIQPPEIVATVSQPGAFPVNNFRNGSPASPNDGDDAEALAQDEENPGGDKKVFDDTDDTLDNHNADEPAVGVEVIATNVDGNDTARVSESERKKIKAIEMEEMKKKIISNAAQADVVEVGRNNSNRRCVFIVVGLIIVLGAIISIAVAASGSGKKSNKSSSASPRIPTSPPTPKVDPVGSPKQCPTARDISNMMGQRITGTNVEAENQINLETCDVVKKNGVGVWYSLKGDGKTKIASTCNSYFDTQISIFEGACGALSCVAANDQTHCGKGDQSMVAFSSEPGSTYYIYVHGHRRAQGIFELVVDDAVANDRCEDAVVVTKELQFGTTRGSTIGPESDWKCGSSEQTSGGVWYKFVSPKEHNSEFDKSMKVSVVTRGITSFQPLISVFEGDSCQNLDCISYGDLSASWNVAPGATYYFLISGKNEGDFFIVISGADASVENLPDGPPNFRPAPCEQAPNILPGETQFGDTAAGLTTTFSTCGRGTFLEGAGTIFRAIGTGSLMRASTCATTSGYDTQISVYRGSCENPICITGNDQSSRCEGDQSTATWHSFDGEIYYLFVNGYSGRLGMFNITIDNEASAEETFVPTGGTCDSAVELPIDQDAVLGSFIGSPVSPSFDADLSCAPDGGRGLWYKISQDTGKRMTVSACDHLSPSSLRLVVFVGDDCSNLSCVKDVVTTPCGIRESVTWMTEEGRMYYVFAQEIMSVDEERALQRTLAPDPDENGNERPCDSNETIAPENELPGGPLDPDDDPLREESQNSRPPEHAETGLFVERELPEGSFTLYAGEAPANDDCENAIGPLRVGYHDDYTFGVLWSATIDDNVPTCLPSTLGRGVWYIVVGTGSLMTIDLCSNNSNAGVRSAVYTGGCGDELVCELSLKEELCFTSAVNVVWKSRPGQLYYILIHGDSLPAELSNFAFIVRGD